jgi:hypothetical protein
MIGVFVCILCTSTNGHMPIAANQLAHPEIDCGPRVPSKVVVLYFDAMAKKLCEMIVGDKGKSCNKRR